jgi:hypothetical protein
VYTLLAAAYRWGLYETIFTTTAAAILLLVEGFLVMAARRISRSAPSKAKSTSIA